MSTRAPDLGRSGTTSSHFDLHLVLLPVVTGHIQCHSNSSLISYKDSTDVRITLSQGTEDTAVWEASGPSLHGTSRVIPPGDVEGRGPKLILRQRQVGAVSRIGQCVFDDQASLVLKVKWN